MQSRTTIRVCTPGTIAAGCAQAFAIDGRDPIAIFNVDGTLHAIDDTCTHGHASLALGDTEGTVVICPLHLGRFDVASGRAIAFPATENVTRYDVTETVDGIFITLDR